VGVIPARDHRHDPDFPTPRGHGGCRSSRLAVLQPPMLRSQNILARRMAARRQRPTFRTNFGAPVPN
jgi:hypothetical protein